MSSAVVLFCVTAFVFCNLKRNRFSLRDHTGFHISYMTEFTAAELNGIFYHKFSICSFNHTGVAFLSAHSSIERSFFYENSTPLSFYQRSNQLAFSGKNGYL